MNEVLKNLETLKNIVSEFLKSTQKYDIDEKTLQLNLKNKYISLRVSSKDEKYIFKQRIYQTNEDGVVVWYPQEIRKYDYYY